jgi:hypothetical protein
MTVNFRQHAGRPSAVLILVLFLGGVLSAAEPARGGRASLTAASERGDLVKPWVDMTLNEPEDARVGRNRFAVTLRDGAGEPLRGAEVSVTLYRPAIFGPKGPIQDVLRTKVRLTPGERAGNYEGVGTIPGAGTWDVTVHVKRQGADLHRSVGRVWARAGRGGHVRF